MARDESRAKRRGEYVIACLTVTGIGVLILAAGTYVFGQAVPLRRSVAITDVSVIPMDAPRVVKHQTVVVRSGVIAS